MMCIKRVQVSLEVGFYDVKSKFKTFYWSLDNIFEKKKKEENPCIKYIFYEIIEGCLHTVIVSTFIFFLVLGPVVQN